MAKESPDRSTLGTDVSDTDQNDSDLGGPQNDSAAADEASFAAENAARGETLSETEVEVGAESADPELSGNEVAGQYLDQLQRLRAEFDNFRKRTARDKEQWWRQAKADLLAELLPVLDDRSRAEAFSEAPDADGLRQILKKLVETLTQLGLEAMETEPGTAFDPELHEAFMTSPSPDVEEGRIVITMEPGYTFEGEILRRAKVSVSSGPATDDG